MYPSSNDLLMHYFPFPLALVTLSFLDCIWFFVAFFTLTTFFPLCIRLTQMEWLLNPSVKQRSCNSGKHRRKSFGPISPQWTQFFSVSTSSDYCCSIPSQSVIRKLDFVSGQESYPNGDYHQTEESHRKTSLTLTQAFVVMPPGLSCSPCPEESKYNGVCHNDNKSRILGLS